jgi:hypothetical protein
VELLVLIDSTFLSIPVGAAPPALVGGTIITSPTESDWATGLEADMLSVRPSVETDRLVCATESKSFEVAGTTFL